MTVVSLERYFQQLRRRTLLKDLYSNSKLPARSIGEPGFELTQNRVAVTFNAEYRSILNSSGKASWNSLKAPTMKNLSSVKGP
eukprot:6456009-Amphidinium_carterae.1